ncbi:MAG: SRPBCC domain-containing protein [Chloroflexota bacterium]
MSESTVKTPTSVQMRRVFNTSPAALFQAWTDPQLLAQWFHPTAQHASSVPILELHEGGRYQIVMHAGENDHTVGGVYQTVEPSKKLVFTWQWGHEPEIAEMLVTVEFNALEDNKTELVLLHERFPHEEERDSHEWGWNGTFEQLEAFIE